MEEVAYLRVDWNSMWEYIQIWVFQLHVCTWHLLLAFCVPSSLSWFLWDFEQFLLSLLHFCHFNLDFACLPFFLILGNCGFCRCNILAVFLFNFGFRFSKCPLFFSGQSGHKSEVLRAGVWNYLGVIFKHISVLIRQAQFPWLGRHMWNLTFQFYHFIQ